MIHNNLWKIFSILLAMVIVTGTEIAGVYNWTNLETFMMGMIFMHTGIQLDKWRNKQ